MFPEIFGNFYVLKSENSEFLPNFHRLFKIFILPLQKNNIQVKNHCNSSKNCIFSQNRMFSNIYIVISGMKQKEDHGLHSSVDASYAISGAKKSQT